MIIVRLWGGLGNQMFQYAAARRLAHANRTELLLDAAWFGNAAAGDTARRYELSIFAIAERFAAPSQVRALRGYDIQRWPRLAKRLLRAYGYRERESWARERHYHFDPAVLRLGDGVYLDGYWQSERYFQDAADLIRTEFAFRPSPAPDNAALLEVIAGCEAVSLHVRRGDYVANARTAHYHGVCGLDYYARCVDAIAGLVASPHFFVFSDDPAWVRDNLKLPFPATHVTHNGPERAYEDLRLMSACRHNIIANSSFSWWGAWLNDTPVKIVIAPKQWFRDDSVDTADLIPERWHRL
jgi:hypothetical protein